MFWKNSTYMRAGMVMARLPLVAISPSTRPITMAMASPTTALSNVLTRPLMNVARYCQTIPHALLLKIVSINRQASLYRVESKASLPRFAGRRLCVEKTGAHLLTCAPACGPVRAGLFKPPLGNHGVNGAVLQPGDDQLFDRRGELGSLLGRHAILLRRE